MYTDGEPSCKKLKITKGEIAWFLYLSWIITMNNNITIAR